MANYSQQPMTMSTRGRLMAAALELFAQRGFRRTTVGEIEAAAGLTARGGAMYKHFASKKELLEEAVGQRIEEILRMREELLKLLPLEDLRSEAALLLRWILTELHREREINAIIEKEGDEFPELRERFYRELVEPGYRGIAEVSAQRFNPALGLDFDPEAIAVLIGGALVNYRRSQWTFGEVILDVDEERLVRIVLEALILPHRR